MFHSLVRNAMVVGFAVTAAVVSMLQGGAQCAHAAPPPHLADIAFSQGMP